HGPQGPFCQQEFTPWGEFLLTKGEGVGWQKRGGWAQVAWRRMFDALSDRFDAIFTRLRGRGRLGEPEVDEVLREIRLALLEADVNFKVVKGLVARIKEQCVGADLSKSLSPAQQVIQIVHNELVATLGGE